MGLLARPLAQKHPRSTRPHRMLCSPHEVPMLTLTGKEEAIQMQQTRSTRLSISSATLMVALLVASSVSLAQVPGIQSSQPSQPSKAPAVQGAQQPQASPSPSPSPNSEEARPLYGLQGVLVETLSGKVVASQYEDQQFNPASAVKPATALAALRTLGPEHRFATGIWTDGVLDKSTGTITGNIYVSGRDPSF